MAYDDVVQIFKSAPNTVIVMDTDGVKVICTTVDGQEYRFNADWIPPDSLEWMAEVFERNLLNCHERAVKSTKAEIRTNYFKFLSIFGGC